MSASPSLSALPEEALFTIGDYLSPQDLLALSATCKRLRSTFNRDHVWRIYTCGGHISQALSDVQSVVSPTFSEPDNDSRLSSLEPLCEQRLHFLKQSRLLRNFRQGKFVKHSAPFESLLLDSDDRFSEFCITSEIMYKGSYLFATRRTREVLVYNIQETPVLFTSFELIKREQIERIYHLDVTVEVVEDLLLIGRIQWFDVYKIKLPDKGFPLLHTINLNVYSSQNFDKPVHVQNFLLINESTDIIHVWDIKTGAKLDDIRPKIEGSKFEIFRTKPTSNIVSLLAWTGNSVLKTVYLFNVNSMQYKDFCPILPQEATRNGLCLTNDIHVVIIEPLLGSILVYNIHSSAMIAQKIYDIGHLCRAFLSNKFLVMVSGENLEVMCTTTLNTVWELPEILPFVSLIDMLGYFHFIAVQSTRSGHTEVWDLVKQRKCFDLDKNTGDDVLSVVPLGSSVPKLITSINNRMQVLNFW